MPTWPRATHPVAPDDDPDFLQSLDAMRSREDRDLFEKWERDLRRREDELRNQAGDERQGGDDRRQGDERRRGDDPHRGTSEDRRRGAGDDLRQQNEEGQPEG